MAQSFSFDVVSKIDLEEVLNAVNQATKEMSQRFDFKDSKSSVTLNRKDREITLVADDDMKRRSVLEILHGRLAKRGVSLKGLEYGPPEVAFSGTITQKIVVQSGLSPEHCKEIVKIIKSLQLNVKTSIQDAQVRVSSPKKDDLQAVIQRLRGEDFSYHVGFDNLR
ncbi:MAG: YajQ family cyclic di-GMP-binding protein [candidate division Zixibacteria bacterium]|nr:YajQ family cyclic di-GMP-binding protein [candidate division Zixibacteria bacterium]